MVVGVESYRRPFELQAASSALSQAGVSLDIRALPTEIAAELETAHVTFDELERIAGDDNLIKTRDELGALLRRVANPPASHHQPADLTRAQALCDKLSVQPKPFAVAAQPSSGSGYGSAGLRAPRKNVLDEAPAAAPELIPTSVSVHKAPAYVRADPAVDQAWKEISARPAANAHSAAPRQYAEAMEAKELKAKAPRGAEGLMPLTESVAMSRLGSADVKHFMATGTLPDLADNEGKVLARGEDRLAEIEASASHGNWPSENALAYLCYGRQSALDSEAAALTASAKALPANDPKAATQTQAAEALRASSKEIGKVLLGIKAEATLAREHAHGASLDRAQALRNKGSTLDTAAAKETDPNKKASLVKAADAARTQATNTEAHVTKLSEAETHYRKGMHGAAFDPRGTLKVAARAQLATGAAKVHAEAANPRPADAPPAELGDGKDVNGQRGAGAILTESRNLLSASHKDGEQAGLEAARSRAIGDFHQNASRVEEKSNTPPKALAGRYGRIAQARVDESGAIDLQRAAMGPSPKGEVALADATLAGRQTEIWDGMSTVLAKSQQNVHLQKKVDELVPTQRAAAKDAGARVKAAEKALEDRRANAAEALDDTDPLLGDLGRSKGERDRAWQTLKDANTHVGAAEEARNKAQAEERSAKAQLEHLEAQQKALDVVLPEDVAGTAFTKPLPATNEPQALRYTQAQADRYAKEQTAGLDRAAATLTPHQVKAYAPTIAHQRLDAASHQRRSLDNQARGLGDKVDVKDQAARLTLAAEQVSATRTALTTMPASAQKSALAVRAIETTCDLAVTGGAYAPGTSDKLLGTAEHVANDHLHGAQQSSGREVIGIASAKSLANAKENLGALAASDAWDPKASADLVARGKRLLAAPAARPSEERAEADAILAKHGGSGGAFAARLGASGAQIDRGGAAAAAQIRDNANAEAGAVQMIVASEVEAPFWMRAIDEEVTARVTGKPKQDSSFSGMIHGAADQKANRTIGFMDRGNARLKHGADELVQMHARAQAAGEGDAFIDAVRVWSDPGLPLTSPAHAKALGVLQKYAEQVPGAGDLEYQHFLKAAVSRGQVPAAAALGGSSLKLGDDLARSTRAGNAASTTDMADAVNQSATSLKETAETFQPYQALSITLQLGLAYFSGRLIPSTGLLEAPGMISKAAQAEKLAEAGVAGAKATRAVTMTSRLAKLAANPTLRAAGSHLLIGGGTALASKAVDATVGKDTNSGRSLKAVINMAPLVAAPRSAGVAAEAEAAMTTGQRARAMLKGLGLVGAIGATQHLAPAALEKLGVRDHAAQEALGIAFGAVLVGGVAAAGRLGARPTAEHALGKSELPGPQRAKAERSIQEFVAKTEGRVPTEADVFALKTKLAGDLGVKTLPPELAKRLDTTVEAVRAHRAIEVAAAEDGQHPGTSRIDRAAESLARARGPNASAPQALLDVSEAAARNGTTAMQAQAQTAVGAPPPPRPAHEVTAEWHAMTPEQRLQRFQTTYPTSTGIPQLDAPQMERAFGKGPFGQHLANLLEVPGVADLAKSDPARAALLYQKFVAHQSNPPVFGQVPLPRPANALHLETQLDAVLPKMVSMGKRGEQFHAALSKNGLPDEPAVRLGPDQQRDGNGAMHLHESVYNPATNTMEQGSLKGSSEMAGAPRIRSSFTQQQVQAPPGAAPLQWNQVVVFNFHGGTTGFQNMTNAQAAKLIVDSTAVYNQNKFGGAPSPRYVLLDSCHQGTLRSDGRGGTTTNAKELQTLINAEAARQGVPSVTVLAADQGGVTYTNGNVPRPYDWTTSQTPDNHGTVPATIVPADAQRGGIDPDAMRDAVRRIGAPQARLSPVEKVGIVGIVAFSAGGAAYVINAKADDERSRPAVK